MTINEPRYPWNHPWKIQHLPVSFLFSTPPPFSLSLISIYDLISIFKQKMGVTEKVDLKRLQVYKIPLLISI